jgi:polar amino acid transport system substrate-binding protein
VPIALKRKDCAFPGCIVERLLRCLLSGLLLALSALVVLPAMAQTQTPPSATAAVAQDPLKVAIRVIPPFVMPDGDKFTGFSIDLWQALSNTMGRPFTYIRKGPLAELLDSVKTKEADLAIAAISITSRREELFDFSQPMFDSGLQIMVRSDGDSGSGALWSNLKNLLTSGIMPALWAFLAGLILVPAHLVWWFERKHDNAIVRKPYIPGIFDAIWWATGAAHGQQPDQPKSSVGRAMSSISVIVSVIFIAFFTANVTTVLTIQQLRGDINGLDDLKGRKVATTAGSSTAEFLRSRDMTLVTAASLPEVYALLLEKKVDAVVFDSPVLLYYAANEGRGQVEVVGSPFRQEAYGILFEQSSTLRKPVNEALLKLRENGTYDILYRKWFSKDEKSDK